MKLHFQNLRFDNWHVVMTCFIWLDGKHRDLAAMLMNRDGAPVHTFDNNRLWFQKVSDGEAYAHVLDSLVELG
jgi:hypothetical protein